MSGNCPSCGKKVRLIDVKMRDKVWFIPETCQSCMNEKIKEEQQREKTNLIDRREKVLSLAEVGEAYDNASFENLKSREGLYNSIIWSKRFADRIKNNSPEKISVVLTGTTGNGKTYLASCINNQLLNLGFNVLMTKLPILFNKMSDYKVTQDILNIIKDLDALIIDDLGIESFTSKRLEWFFLIMDKLVNHKIPFLITTNNLNQEIFHFSKMTNQDLLYSQRIFSRIHGMCKGSIIKNEASDYRIQGE